MKVGKNSLKFLITCYVMIVSILISTPIEVHAATNANIEAHGDTEHIAIARMGRKYGWSDSYVKQINGYYTYQITGINDSRNVKTSDPASNGHNVTGNGTYTRSLSGIVCKQGHGNAYILTFEQIPTCTSGGWVCVGCSSCAYSTYWFQTGFAHRIDWGGSTVVDNSSHYFFYQDALGHESVYGGKAAIHTKCKYCGATTSSTHSYTTNITKEATCTEKETKKYSCVCGYSYTEDIPALGHIEGDYTYQNDAWNNGFTNWYRNKYCTRPGCGAHLVAQMYVQAEAGTGISSASTSKWYNYGETIVLDATVKTGYIWSHWNGGGSTTGYVDYANQHTEIEGIAFPFKFTAYATPITYKIRFNGNGNWNTSQGSYTQTITYDTHTALIANKFTRPNNTTYNDTLYKIGYEFVGWGTSPTQKTPTYTDGQIVNNLTATDGEIIDLYAIWKKTVTLTINFNGGKFNNSTTSKVLSYTMYNSELNHTFDIAQYYGTPTGTDYYDKGLNNNLTKTVDSVQQRFLGYSLSKTATIPDEQFDVYDYADRTENYNIRDNTTLYAIYEPVLQMTVSLSTQDSHAVPIQITNTITVVNELGNFMIPRGTKNTSLPNNTTALLENKFTGINVVNSGTVNYTISAKGNSNITFGMAADSRILDIYTNGADNTWYDELNQESDFLKVIDNFTTVTDDFRIPKYLGTTQSHPTSNPNSSDNSIVYGIKFTCTQPSYYYEKYWNTDESISIYGVLFLQPTEIPDDTESSIPDYSDFNIITILE